ncbi:MAG: hypothetical protein HYY49_05715 [Ignavibacteriales bacterium]|nr:hypothetical protein [Ignavibacteriales bacterium]
MKEPRNIETFIHDLEVYANRKLNFPEDVAWLLECAGGGMQQVFADVIFQAKFVIKTQEIMKRIGPAGDGFDKLSAEFGASFEKTTTLLKTLVKEAPEEKKTQFVSQFLTLNDESFAQLMKLFADLSWVKNWQIDGKPLPNEE